MYRINGERHTVELAFREKFYTAKKKVRGASINRWILNMKRKTLQ